MHLAQDQTGRHDTEAPHVNRVRPCGRFREIAAPDFGAAIFGRERESVSVGAVAVPREAKVSELNRREAPARLMFHQDVFELYIAVDNLLVTEELETQEELLDDPGHVT